MTTSNSRKNVDLLLLLPRLSARDSAAFLVHHPERARLLPKLTLLNWRRLQGVCRYSVVQLRNHLYFIGGYKPAKRKYSRQVLRYDLSNNTWYYCNKMRTGRADFQAFVFDGRVFCCGGRVSEQELTPLCESFEPSANSWTPENPLPVACSEFACAGVDQELVLLLGGVCRSPNGSLRCQSHVWRFGLVKSANPYLDFEYDWQRMPSGANLPNSRGLRGHSTLLDSRLNRLYVIGGAETAAGEQPQAMAGDESDRPLPGIFYCDAADMKAIADLIDRKGLNEAASATVAWRRRGVQGCCRLWPAVAMLGHKIFVVGGTRQEATREAKKEEKANEDDEKKEEKEEEKEDEKEKEKEGHEDQKELEKQEEEQAKSKNDEYYDVGYYDTRRKLFRGMFSLSNGGIDTCELLAVKLAPQTSNKELRPDRLDWLLQWSLW